MSSNLDLQDQLSSSLLTVHFDGQGRARHWQAQRNSKAAQDIIYLRQGTPCSLQDNILTTYKLFLTSVQPRSTHT